MTISRQDASKAVNQSKQVVEILEMNKLTDYAAAVRLVTEAIKNQHTIIVLK
jgi:hypothetical protein